ncbi:MAG: dienelactone hydrolase family protein, partial [Clostridia bacterium]|nr:dienelactone hydrolase family protein [Clostridia bacterium]
YVDRIKALKPGDKVSAQELMGAPSSYWLDLKSYDPVKTAQKLDKPLLVLQGGRDYQVTQADFELWKAGLSSKSSVTFKFYDNLNHLFMAGEGKSTPDEYAVKGTFSQDAINDMAAFINKK